MRHYLQLIDTSSGKNIATGNGECGLPPKKPDVYLADFSDVRAYCADFISHMAHVSTTEGAKYDPFQKLEARWFASLRSTELSAEASAESIVRWLFFALDTVPLNQVRSRKEILNSIT